MMRTYQSLTTYATTIVDATVTIAREREWEREKERERDMCVPWTHWWNAEALHAAFKYPRSAVTWRARLGEDALSSWHCGHDKITGSSSLTLAVQRCPYAERLRWQTDHAMNDTTARTRTTAHHPESRARSVRSFESLTCELLGIRQTEKTRSVQTSTRGNWSGQSHRGFGSGQIETLWGGTNFFCENGGCSNDGSECLRRTCLSRAHSAQ